MSKLEKWVSPNSVLPEGFWDPQNAGDKIHGVLIRFASEGEFPFFVFQILGGPCRVMNQDKSVKDRSDGYVGVANNFALKGLERKVGCEIEITYKGKVKTSNAGRQVKQFDILASREPVEPPPTGGAEPDADDKDVPF